MSDPWVSLTILVISILAGWWFVRWDRRMEEKHYARLEAEIAKIEKMRVRPSEKL